MDGLVMVQTCKSQECFYAKISQYFDELNKKGEYGCYFRGHFYRLNYIPGSVPFSQGSKFFAEVIIGLLSKENKLPKVCEIGTGSGIIPIVIWPYANEITATDIDSVSLEAARINLINHKVKNVKLQQGDLFDPLSGEQYDYILFNPPYMPSTSILCKNKSCGLRLGWEGGADGRKLIDSFVLKIKQYLRPRGAFLLLYPDFLGKGIILKKIKSLGMKCKIKASCGICVPGDSELWIENHLQKNHPNIFRSLLNKPDDQYMKYNLLVLKGGYS
jgi:release factor glutamine methyltransferase